MADPKKPDQATANQAEDLVLSARSLRTMQARIDDAINAAQSRIGTLQRELNEVEGVLQRLHNTKSKISTLGVAAEDIETIRGISSK